MDKYMLCFKLVDVRFFSFIYDLGFSDYVVYKYSSCVYNQ